MRGTLRMSLGAEGYGGIIPAHAGNTSSFVITTKGQADHPRSCGEHELDAQSSGDMTGSSPLMRGTLVPNLHFYFQQGIIPAHAGNTLEEWFEYDGEPDHPRSCGEHVSLLA